MFTELWSLLHPFPPILSLWWAYPNFPPGKLLVHFWSVDLWLGLVLLPVSGVEPVIQSEVKQCIASLHAPDCFLCRRSKLVQPARISGLALGMLGHRCLLFLAECDSGRCRCSSLSSRAQARK